MADDPKPLDELVDQAEDKDAADGKKEKPARKLNLPLKKIIIFAAVGCVSVGAAYAVTMFLSPSAPAVEGVDEGGEPPAIEVKTEKKSEKKAEKKSEGARESEAPLHNVESIIVNLAKCEGRRYLKTSLVFRMKSEEAVRKLEGDKVMVTDKLIQVLSSKTIEEIDGAERKTELKREIRDEMNALIGVKDAVTEVMFTEFIIQ